MQRFVIAVLFLAIAASLIAFLVASITRVAKRSENAVLLTTGDGVQKISFILLIGLMIYVSMSGAN
jgi:hypothetical protein